MRHEDRFSTQDQVARKAEGPAVAASATAATARPRAKRTEDTGLVLRRYRVSNYRSVTDSGWLDLARVTALIGVNESGKTNLLLPLWKLNPASGGELRPTSDYPKSLFATIRNDPGSFQFVTAEFDTGTHAGELADLAGISRDEAKRISVARLYDGGYQLAFPDYRSKGDEIARQALGVLESTRGTLDDLTAPPGQEALLDSARTTLSRLSADLNAAEALTGNDLRLARNAVAALIPEDPPATSPIIPQLRSLQKTLGTRMAEMIAPDPASREEVRAAVLNLLPRFVYYSNYGNLDSEIYLPHVVENLGRGDLGAKESAKARTLRVLFDFVGLQAREVLELGRDFRDIRDEAEAKMIAEQGKAGLLRSLWTRARGNQDKPDAETLAQIAEAKRTRSILLQSAGTKLTARFAEWWKQGDYRFRFEADGNHFRIWVADSRRPQEVELEHRSTGLQWFLSFFLVFLHEGSGAHRNAVLLLDEPGHSLHPLAQRDLSAFFEGLSTSNQIVYTTHSPFLVDADRLSRARKVYVDADGSTRVSADLMEGSDGGFVDARVTESRRGAAYAVRAAVNLAVAEAGLAGAQPVLVTGKVDQTYLATIKTLCVAGGRFHPSRELIFAPAVGSQIIEAVTHILGGDGAAPPRLVLDRVERALDDDGMPLAEDDSRVSLEEIVGFDGATTEDLMPQALIAAALDRVERRPERLFGDVVRPGRPIVQQALDWASSEGIVLPADWRHRVAERVRDRLLVQDRRLPEGQTLALWLKLMQALDSEPGMARPSATQH